MNPNTFLEILQQSFRVSVGAATALVETLQDPQKREQTLSQFNTDFSKQTQAWAVKGEETEREARRIIDEIWQQQGRQNSSQTSEQNRGSEPRTIEITNSDSPSELQDLTEQVVALRQELENLRQSKSKS